MSGVTQVPRCRRYVFGFLRCAKPRHHRGPHRPVGNEVLSLSQDVLYVKSDEPKKEPPR